MKHINPLFISPYVFDEENINARINTALINSLPKDYVPVVLCGDISQYNNRSQILSIKFSLYDKIKIKLLLKLTRMEICYLPDTHYYYWYKKALAKVEDYLKENKIDYMHSFSVPYTSHLVAYELKKKYNIPWIAHFYEPWGDNYFRKKSKKVTNFNITWERIVANAADVIIHNSDTMCESWKTRYSDIDKLNSKIKCLPMTFEFGESFIDSPSRNVGDKLQITHVGNFYGLRRALPFFSALCELINEIPKIRNYLTVTLVGDVMQEDVDFAKKYNLLDIIEIVGRKSEEECISYYKKADLFLVIESEQQGPLFFPSKLIQYYYYNRPILGITISQSVLYKELIATGHNAFNPSDIEGVKNFLKKALFDYDSLLNYNKGAWERFDSKNVVKDYLEIVNKILSTKNVC